MADYGAVIKFIQEQIIERELQIARLSNPKSSAHAIRRGFAENGWRVVDNSKPESKISRHAISSPDGDIELDMVGAKVFRHPKYTEAICRKKHLTKQLLDLAGLPIPVGGEFALNEGQIASAYFELMPKPVVVKPTEARASQGVSVGVSSVDEFDEAWRHAAEVAREGSSIILEEFIRGVELRAFVVGEEVAGVVARIQAFVVGDGNTSIEDLISQTSDARKVNYRANMFPIEVDWNFVASQGYGAAAVLAVGEIVLLNPFSYPIIGSSVVDVTAIVSEGILDLARRAVAAIPHLEIGGIDLLVEDLQDAKTARVIEVNTAAALDMHRYPTHGSSRMVEANIVKYFHSLTAANSPHPK